MAAAQDKRRAHREEVLAPRHVRVGRHLVYFRHLGPEGDRIASQGLAIPQPRAPESGGVRGRRREYRVVQFHSRQLRLQSIGIQTVPREPRQVEPLSLLE